MNDVLCVDQLKSEDGISAASVQIMTVLCRDVLNTVMDNTPQELKPVLFARLHSALAGVACAEIGPEAAAMALDTAKLAIADAAPGMAKRHAH